MKSYFLAALSLLVVEVSLAGDSLDCHVGPIQIELGGTPWQVTSCDDGRSLVFATMKDNPAIPFFFFVLRDEETTHISGEGNGSKEHSAAAFAELEKMSQSKFDELIQATKLASVGK